MRAGEWREGSIALIDAHPTGEAGQRDWYVWRTEEGKAEVRQPPYTGFDNLYMTALGATTGRATPAPAPARRTPPRPATPGRTAPPSRPASPPAVPATPATPARSRTWTAAEFRAALIGMDEARVRAFLGSPDRIEGKDWSFSGLRITDPSNPGARYTRTRISFTEVSGGTIWYVYITD